MARFVFWVLLWIGAVAFVTSIAGCGRQPTASGAGADRQAGGTLHSKLWRDNPERAAFVGVWRLEPGEDLVEAARKLGRDVPSMELEAYEDGTFDLVGRVGEREFEVSGEWFVAEREVTLRAKEVSGDAPILESETEPRGGTLSEDGKRFVDAGGWVWRREESR